MEIDADTWLSLQGMVCCTNFLAHKVVEERDWKLVIFDDNAFDFSKLERILNEIGQNRYYFVPILDLEKQSNEARIIAVDIGTSGWKPFFEFDESGYSPSLEDCILFTSDLTFAILRTGYVEHTIYAGSDTFLREIVGVEMGLGKVIAIGTHWPNEQILDYYKPKIAPLGT